MDRVGLGDYRGFFGGFRIDRVLLRFCFCVGIVVRFNLV